MDDVEAIQAAYETVFERKRSMEEWRWRFLDAPAGPAHVYVLESESRIVGHASHVPIWTWVDGNRVLLGQGDNTMMLPEYRGRGGMRQLVDVLLADEAFDLRMNFPSDMARDRFVRYGAGTIVGSLESWIYRRTLARPLPALARPLAGALLAGGRFVAERPRPRLTVEPLDEPGAEFDELAEASASFARCIRVRDAAYLRWRWLEQPEARWELRAARARDGRLVGYSVLGREAGTHGPTGLIGDLLAVDRQALRALLLDAVTVLAGREVGSIRCEYLDPRLWARRTLLRAGFLRMREKDDPFMARSLSSAVGDAPELPGSWYLTLSDTEPWPNLADG